MVRTMLEEYDLPNDTSGTFKAKCRHCGSSISGGIRVQSNFATHLKWIDKMNTVTVKLKRFMLLIGSLLVCGVVFIFVLPSTNEKPKSPLLAITDTTPCETRIGNTLEENLRKIDSYKFPAAKPYLKELLPPNFKFQDASHWLSGDKTDQSLPSFPALVTAVSANHYSEAMELVGNVNHQVRAVNKDIKFFIYDLGLTASQSIKLKEQCNCDVIPFPFEDFPDHIRIMKGYAWKPLAIQLALKQHRFVMWMDSSIRFQTKHLNWAYRHAQSLGVSASVGFAPIAARTQKATFEFLEETPCVFRDTNEFEATFIMIYANDFVMQYFMVPWISCALTKGCMVPLESPEKYLTCDNDNYYFNCHRFDQSILSILMTRLFHHNIKEHVMVHTFFKICKGGFDLPYLPDFINKKITEYMRSCF